MAIPSDRSPASPGSAKPVTPTPQASVPATAAVRQTSTHPALVGAMPGNDSMAAFQAAAQAAVDRIMRPAASDRPGREVPMDRRG